MSDRKASMIYVLETPGREELLVQLAEECSELAQAALKLRRVLDGRNPTPVTREEAEANLQEEMADVIGCMFLVGPPDQKALTESVDYKMERWADRIRQSRL